MQETDVNCEGHDFSGDGQEFFPDCGICKDLRDFLYRMNND